jgi:hypothetical protein
MWIRRYNRSRFFTIVFCMQKLSGKSMAMLCKSCMTVHTESNKIGLALFLFFCNFLRIFKDSATTLYYLRIQLSHRPLELFSLLQIGPWFMKKTLERMRETQCSPWALREARLTRIGRLRRRPWPGKRWGRTRGSPAVDL